MKKTFVLVVAIVLIISLTVFTIITINAGKKYDIVNANGDVIKQSDMTRALASSAKLLRDDHDTVLATVNGKEITAYDLNITRTVQAFDDLEKEFTEKELLDIIIEDRVICEYTAENGYVYKSDKASDSISDSAEAELSGSLSDYDIYAASSGLDEKSYADMERWVDEKLKTYSKYLDLIMEPLLDGTIGVEDEEYEKVYAEYKRLIAVDSMEEIDWDSVNACTNELVERFTQHLVDEADVVIYEDKLN